MLLTHVTLLGLLGMSVAFDTVDFEILLRRLEITCGIGGQVLEWFASFLSDRTQIVSFAPVAALHRHDSFVAFHKVPC